MEASPGRLAWRCRRGMKELDLLLTRYLAERWPSASAEERTAFEALLEQPDPVLVDWLYGRTEPADEITRQLVAQLHAVRPRPAAP